MPLRTLLCLLALFAGGLCQAEIYSWKDAGGHTHFGDKPPAGSGAEQVDLDINTVHNPQSASPATGTTGSRQVVIYTADWCGVCRKAKRYFMSNAIPYREYDVEHSAKGRRDYRRLKGSGVPIILVGEQRMDGFTPEGFDRLYRQP